MKKWMSLLIVTSVFLGLIGCVNKTQNDKTVQEIMDKATEASQNLKSFHISMDIDQTSTQNEGQPVETDMKMEMDFVSDPLAVHEVLEIEAIPYKMEMYLTEEGSYSKDSTTNIWMKMPDELYGSTAEIARQQSDASLTLEKFKEYTDELKVERKEDEYIISLASSEEKFKKLIIDTLKGTMPEGASIDEVLEMITINSINYVFTIERETYYPRQMQLQMDLNLEVEGNKIHTIQDIHATYSRFNEVEKIVVPEEVKEQANIANE